MRTHFRTAAVVAASLLTGCSDDFVTRAIPRPAVAHDMSAAASGRTVIVTERDISRQVENTPPLRNWVLYSRFAGTGAFRIGPATPPLGAGSLELSTPTGADKVTLFNYDEVGTPLGSVSSMSYATYRTSGSAQQVAALNVEVDVNGAAPGGFTTLVFEPVYNTAQGGVVSNRWQAWDAYKGGQAIWWSSRPIPGALTRDNFVTWSSIIAANPNAVIVGGYGINQGSGNPGLITAVDALHFDTSARSVTWNFEPSGKDNCSNGERKSKKHGEESFQSQGDCDSDTDH